MNYSPDILNLDSYKQIGHNTIKSRLYNLKRQGKIIHIRKGVYLPAGMNNKFQIACNSVENGVLSYHSALEYYLLHTQAFNWTYIHSDKPFRSFEHLSETYVYKPLKFLYNPIVENKDSNYPVRVTSLNQTIIDCIYNIGLGGGLEEVMFALVDLPSLGLKLDEKSLIKCLELYDYKSLYQRVGFLLSHFKDGLVLSDNFFAVCKSKMGNTVSYLVDPSGSQQLFFKDWNICAPQDIMSEIEKGVLSEV